MKKLLIFLMVALYSIPMASAAFAAGGAGPSAFIMKGVFLEVHPEERTAVFIKEGTRERRTFLLPASISLDKIELNKKMMIELDEHAAEGTVKELSVMFLDMTGKRLLALLVVGFIGGLLSGFIGSGGAFVLTPAMMSLGVPGAVAVASNMCHKFPKAMVGAYKRYKYGQADIKLGMTMAVTAIIGVQIGIQIQKYILNQWGNAGSNLYVSTIFVIVLVLVGAYVLSDAYKLAKGGASEKVSKLALRMQKITLPPVLEFKVAKVKISAWVVFPVGLFTGILAATIAVGGFIGVPGMIYVVGASAMVASATELIVAFVMGAWGSVQWGLSGLIDIRLTLLILATSLIGVQLGALGTTYVKDYMIKIVMATTMLIIAVSRGAKIPGYLADLGLRSPMEAQTVGLLDSISFWTLVAALATAGLIITVAMIKGMAADRKTKRAVESVSHG